MPLEKAPVGSAGFSRNIATEIEAGKPQKQAVAIAYEKARGDASGEFASLSMEQLKKRLSTAKMVAGLGSGSSKRAGNREIQALQEEIKYREIRRKDSAPSIDALFTAADALYARSDAMQTGRWDGISGGVSRIKELQEEINRHRRMGGEGGDPEIIRSNEKMIREYKKALGVK